jgi:hypothetical protein
MAQLTLRKERARLTKWLFGRMQNFLSDFSWQIQSTGQSCCSFLLSRRDIPSSRKEFACILKSTQELSADYPQNIPTVNPKLDIDGFKPWF